MAFTNGNDLNLLQASDSAVVGAGAGNDIYIVSPGVLTAGQRVTVSDVQGVNTLRLTGDLTVVSSRATGSSVELTLSNGSVVAILDANAFRFELGGEGLGAGPVVQTFAQLLTQTLGYGAVPPQASGVVSNLTPAFVQPDGSVTRTATPPPPPVTVTKLTPQADTLEGDAGDNLFTATLAVNPTLTTLNPADILNGGAGRDTLRITAASDFAGFAPNRGMINFEVLELLNGVGTPRNFDATGVLGLERIEIQANDESVSFTDLAASTLPLTVQVSGIESAQMVSMAFADDAAAGVNDTIGFELNAVGRLATPTRAEAVVSLRADEIELLTLTSLRGVSVVDAAIGASRRLDIDGPGDLRITRVDTSLQVVDASAATGDLSLDVLDIGANTLKSATLGKGDDVIRLASSQLVPNAQLTGGDGADELILLRPSQTQDPVIAGFESVRLVDTNQDFTFALNNSAGMDTLTIERGVSAGRTVAVSGGLQPLELIQLRGASVITPGIDGTLRYLNDGAVQVTASKEDLSGNVVGVEFDAPLLDRLTLDVENGVTYGANVSIASADQVTLNVAANATYRGVVDAPGLASLVVTGLANEVTFLAGSELGQSGQKVTVDATGFEGKAFNLDIMNQQDLTFAGGPLGTYNLTLLGDRGVLDITGGINDDQVMLDQLGAGPHDYRIDLGVISDNDVVIINTKDGVAEVDLSDLELVGVDQLLITLQNGTTLTLPDGVTPADVTFVGGNGRVEVLSTPQDEVFDFADLDGLEGVFAFQATAAANGFDEIRGFSANNDAETLDFARFNEALVFTPTGTTALMTEEGLYTKNPLILGGVDLTDEIVRLVDIVDGQNITTAEGLTAALRQGGEFANLNVKNGSALFLASKDNDPLSDAFLFFVNAGADGLETATAVGVVRAVGVQQFTVADFEGAISPPPEMMLPGLF